jgi:hypothetical protein
MTGFFYSLQPILLFTNTNISTIKMCLDTSILTEYYGSEGVAYLAANKQCCVQYALFGENASHAHLNR